MICPVRLGGNRNMSDAERAAELLCAGIEDGFAIVRGVHARRHEPVPHVGDAIVRQNHRGPAAVPDRRHAAFSDRLGLFEYRRFTIVLQEDDVVAGLFLHRFAGAGQDIGFRPADDFLLIGIFADGRLGGAAGDCRETDQSRYENQPPEQTGRDGVCALKGGCRLVR